MPKWCPDSVGHPGSHRLCSSWIALDITVLVYAVGTDHPFRKPSRSTGLVSADRAFAEVTGLVHHDLAASDVLDMLGYVEP